jgi:hypothetical protein
MGSAPGAVWRLPTGNWLLLALHAGTHASRLPVGCSMLGGSSGTKCTAHRARLSEEGASTSGLEEYSLHGSCDGSMVPVYSPPIGVSSNWEPAVLPSSGAVTGPEQSGGAKAAGGKRARLAAMPCIWGTGVGLGVVRWVALG